MLKKINFLGHWIQNGYVGSEQTGTSSGSKGDVLVVSTCLASSLHADGMRRIAPPFKKNPHLLVLLSLVRFFHKEQARSHQTD